MAIPDIGTKGLNIMLPLQVPGTCTSYFGARGRMISGGWQDRVGGGAIPLPVT